MRKVRVVIALAALACLGIFAAAAQATEWAGSGYYLASGQNGFLNHKVSLYAADGLGENRAVCAGIREVGSSCAGRGYIAEYVLSSDVYSEPYLHNHDTAGGYFRGFYYS